MSIKSDSLGIQPFLDALASRSSTPGGGSAAAAIGASGAALLGMVIEFSQESEIEITEANLRCARSRARLLELAGEDMTAFDEVMFWYKKDRRGDEYQQALHGAALVPSRIMAECAALLDVARLLQSKGNKNLITDVAIGAEFLAAAITSADLNVMINARAIHAEDVRRTLRREADALLGCAEELRQICREIRLGL